MSFKPLLAEPANFDILEFPVYVSPKYDGFRCLIDPYRGPVTRSLKPIVNNYVRGKLSEWNIKYLDGELMTYTGGKLDDFNVVQSKLSSRMGMPDFRFFAFDSFRNPKAPFSERMEELLSTPPYPPLTIVTQHLTHSIDGVMHLESKFVDEGFEGAMLRRPDGIYKFGRSTAREQILLKVKRTQDDEGQVIEVQELRHNANEAVTNELGYTERSSHKANMVGRGMLGALTVKWRDVVFDLGTGFSEAQRHEFWKENVVGRTVTFGYQGVGPNGKPRFPRFRGFRYDLEGGGAQ